MVANMEQARPISSLDWSARGRARVWTLTALGTLLCIAVAFAVDSYDMATGNWRWGSDPVNNFVIPVLLAPPCFFFMLDKMRQLAIAHNELMTVASTDSLTSLLNRRAFTELVDGYLKRVEESERQPRGALLVIDVDHFKLVNDRFGHESGDEALKLIAQTIRESVRDTDLVGRIGGEEFCVVAPNTPLANALQLGERIVREVRAGRYGEEDNRFPVTLSVGVATRDPGDTDLEAFLTRADKALYAAKSGGRDRVMVSRGDSN
jgi:diguanylate cyclase (GGDEF)-like protein